MDLNKVIYISLNNSEKLHYLKRMGKIVIENDFKLEKIVNMVENIYNKTI